MYLAYDRVIVTLKNKQTNKQKTTTTNKDIFQNKSRAKETFHKLILVLSRSNEKDHLVSNETEQVNVGSAKNISFNQYLVIIGLLNFITTP